MPPARRSLFPCPHCALHIKTEERTCPHCATALDTRAWAPAPAVLPVALGLMLAGCNKNEPPSSPPEPMYGVPVTDDDLTEPSPGEPANDADVGEPEYGVPAVEDADADGSPEPIYGIAEPDTSSQ